MDAMVLVGLGLLTQKTSSSRRVAPVPVILSNLDEGAPGPSLLGTGEGREKPTLPRIGFRGTHHV